LFKINEATGRERERERETEPRILMVLRGTKGDSFLGSIQSTYLQGRVGYPVSMGYYTGHQENEASNHKDIQ
jgi:hypothetical protein